MEKLQIYLDDSLVPLEEAKVSVEDRGFLYGDGLFETMRTYHGEIFLLDRHIKRLYQSAEIIGLNLHLSQEEMRKACLKTLSANNFPESKVRITVSRGISKGKLNFSQDDRPTLVIIVKPLEPYPKDMYENGVKIITFKDIRGNLCYLKSLNYLPNILVKNKVEKDGALEAIFINNEGFVSEGTITNIFIYLDGMLITPPLSKKILPGITRNCVLRMAKELEIKYVEEAFLTDELFQAQEVFLTSTIMEIMPVVRVDDKKISEGRPGPITKKLLDFFHQSVGVKF